jgi:hypothetical protein
MQPEDFIPWEGKLAVLTFDTGEVTTVHILQVDTKRGKIIVDVLDSNRPYNGREHRAFALSTNWILSIRPAPAGIQPRRPAPPPDLCLQSSPLQISHFLELVLMFIILLPVSFILFIMLSDWRYGIQLPSLLAYTAFVTLYTFGGRLGGRPYLFDCTIVRHQLPRLLRSHVGFLAALFVLQTAALHLRPHLPIYWITARGRNQSPFEISLLVLCSALGLTQIFTNRSLLERAHLEFTAPSSKLEP